MTDSTHHAPRGEHHPEPSWHPDPRPELVGDGVGRFFPPEQVRALAGPETPGHPAPSLAMARPPTRLAPLPGEFRAIPRFAFDRGRWLVRVALDARTSVYGLGELAGGLSRAGERATCWNTDQFEYDVTDESLYQSHPWVLGVRADGTSFGVLIDTTFRCEFEIDGEVRAAAHGRPPAVYVIERDTAQQAVAALADLTGHTPLPPRWALGYHQSRWSYEPEARVRELAREFRRRRMPCDAIWLDIDYMDGFRCFTFDPHKFPNPGALNDDLHALGFRSVWMIDPGIKVDPAYAVYAQGRAGGHFLLDSSGNEYHGKVWPGECAFPDFTREATRRWWGDLYSPLLATGLDGVWNDMNEPAVFDNPQKQMPESNRHRADERLGGPDTHARYHNVYGMLMVRATREGIERARPGKRPFVLTRSNFIGGHRYAATWTGDNMSTWDHLAWSIPMVLNLGLSGQPLAGPDIGGFSGDCAPELFARWMGIGSLLPFARGHSIKDSKDHEPWSFGEAAEATCRRALERRMRFLPYLYTLAHEASASGVPICRPLFFADPRDPALREADDAFLLGPDCLVRACVEPELNAGCRAPFPGGAGAWRRHEIVPREDGSSDPVLPELWFRAGSIVPLGPVMQFVDEKPLDPLTLIVCPDAQGQARGELYEDAGDGLEYQQGLVRITTFHSHREGDHVTVHPNPPLGRLRPHDRAVEVVVLLANGQVRTGSGREGKPVQVTLQAGDS